MSFISHPRNQKIATVAALTATTIGGAAMWWSQRQSEVALQVRDAARVVLSVPSSNSGDAIAHELGNSQSSRRALGAGELAAEESGMTLRASDGRGGPFAAPLPRWDESGASESIAEPTALGEALLKLIQGRDPRDGDEEIAKLVGDKLPVPMDRERLLRGIAISENLVDGVLSDLQQSSNPADRAQLTATAFIAYQTMKAFTVAQGLFRVNSMEDFARLGPTERQMISERLATFGWMDHATFGEAVSPVLIPFIRQMASDPSLAERWQQWVFAGR